MRFTLPVSYYFTIYSNVHDSVLIAALSAPVSSSLVLLLLQVREDDHNSQSYTSVIAVIFLSFVYWIVCNTTNIALDVSK